MTIYIIIYSVLLALAAGSVLIFSIVSTRSTKRKAQQDKKAAELEKEGKLLLMEVLSKNLSDTFLFIERSTRRALYVSPNVYRYLAITEDRLKADLFAYRLSPCKDGVEKMDRALSLWNGQSAFRFEFCYAGNNFAKVEVSPVEHGGNGYLTVIISDVTEYVQNRDELKRELGSASAHSFSDGGYIADMSRELGTGINGINGMLSLAKMNISDKSKALGYVDRAGDTAAYLIRVVNDALDYSKIVNAEMQIVNGRLDLSLLPQKIYESFNPVVTGAGVEFTVESFGLDVKQVLCDTARLNQIVSGLIYNAVGVTPRGGKIKVALRQTGKTDSRVNISVRVSDTGGEVATEELGKAFLPFGREKIGAVQENCSTGLGLAISQKLVHMMGGSIEVESLQSGCAFTVYLSLLIAADGVSDDELSGEEFSPETFEYNGLKILLAVNNEVGAEIAAVMLETDGAQVVPVRNGQEVVEKFVADPAYTYDVILLDDALPRLDGKTVTKKIRGSVKPDAQSIAIVALTTNAARVKTKSADFGINRFVLKPIDYTNLKQVIGEALFAQKKEAAKKDRGGD